MAHELSHVALRHGTHQASKANLIQFLRCWPGQFGQWFYARANSRNSESDLARTPCLLKFSRDAESDADILGARMMAKAGYNPIEMARFFEKLEAQGGAAARSSCPITRTPDNRRKAIQQEISLPRIIMRPGNNSELQRYSIASGSLPAAFRKANVAAGAVGGGDPRP